MEEIKEFAALLEADERWAAFGRLDTATNSIRRYSLAERYADVGAITISSSAPETVRSQFNVARMLCIYSWLYYPLHQVAELKAFSSVEVAVRLRFPDRKCPLAKVLTHAVSSGVINDRGFSHIEVNANDPSLHSKQLPKAFTELRNTLAHGSSMLHPGSLFTLRNCAEIINQLFPENTGDMTMD